LGDLAGVRFRVGRALEGALEPRRGDQLHRLGDLPDVPDRLAALDEGTQVGHSSVPGSRFQVPGSRFQVPGSTFQVPGCQCYANFDPARPDWSRYRINPLMSRLTSIACSISPSNVAWSMYPSSRAAYSCDRTSPTDPLAMYRCCRNSAFPSRSNPSAMFDI